MIHDRSEDMIALLIDLSEKVLMPATAETLAIRGLSKQKVAELARAAKHAGVTAEQFVKDHVEEKLTIAREARAKTFAEIAGPSHEVDEDELDKPVERARTRFHARTKR
jgi:hydroxylamine reductase (hybrid-cluster protein)